MDSVKPRDDAGQPLTGEAGGQLRAWLVRAACWRFASTLFRLPAPEALAELRELAPNLPEGSREQARRFLDVDLELWEREYHRILGPGGLACCESSYDQAALAGRGPLLASIAGFYRAFAYRLEGGGQEVPDDIAVELDFLAYLAFKAGYAVDRQLGDELGVTSTAYADFLREHLGFWIAPFLDRLLASDSQFYREVANWTQEVFHPLNGSPSGVATCRPT